MRCLRVVICTSIVAVLGGCSISPNTGLVGIDYTSVQTVTRSGRPVLQEDSLVQPTLRSEGSTTEYFSIRPSKASTGTTDATWLYTTGVYVEEERLLFWASGKAPKTEPRLAAAFAETLVSCAKDLGTVPTIPIDDASQTGVFGKLTVGRDKKVFFQIPLSVVTWKTELDNSAGGGGNAARFLEGQVEVFGLGHRVREGRAGMLGIDVGLKCVSGNSRGFESTLVGLDVTQTSARCVDADLGVNVEGIPLDLSPTGWFPVDKVSYNLTTSLLEGEE